MIYKIVSRWVKRSYLKFNLLKQDRELERGAEKERGVDTYIHLAFGISQLKDL